MDSGEDNGEFQVLDETEGESVTTTMVGDAAGTSMQPIPLDDQFEDLQPQSNQLVGLSSSSTHFSGTKKN